MRKSLVTLAILLLACSQTARADVSNSAPADEYFGPLSQSVLEIRNRLNDYDQRDSRTMLDPDVTASLDHLEAAVTDWQHKYPRDPWLPGVLGHLMREYWRAGQASSDHGMATMAVMRSAYPDSAETTATIALVYGSNTALQNVSRDDNAVPVTEAANPYANIGEVQAPEDQTTPTALSGYADIPASEAAAPSYENTPDDGVPTPPPTR